MRYEDPHIVKNLPILHKEALSLIHHAFGTLRNGQLPPIIPGPLPISIETRHFPILKQNAYVVCEKTDGERNMCVCFTYQGKKVSLLVNRALQFREVTLKFSKATYDATILDGELIDNSFVIFDIIAAFGKNVMEEHFIERIQHIENVLKQMISMKNDPIKLKLKRFFPIRDFKEFKNEYLPTVTQKIDGLIFTPVFEPIRSGTHETLFKWKERDHNTIDFLFKFQNNEWRLYLQEKGDLVFESSMQPREDYDWIRDGMIIECQFMCDERPMWWKPLKQRTDKTYPNNRRTFYRTLVNIKENIKMEEFIL